MNKIHHICSLGMFFSDGSDTALFQSDLLNNRHADDHKHKGLIKSQLL